MKGWQLPFVMAAKDTPSPRLDGQEGLATAGASIARDAFSVANGQFDDFAAASAGTVEVMTALFGSTAVDASDGQDGEDGDDGEDVWRFPDTSILNYDDLDVESPSVRQKLLSIRQKACGVLAFHNGTEDALMCFVERHARRGDPQAVLKVRRRGPKNPCVQARIRALSKGL